MRKPFIHDDDHQRVTRKRVQRGAALAIALGGAVALAATGAPASAADFPTVPIQGVHHCEVIGSADGYQAVVCADLTVSGDDSSGNYFSATGAIEVYCQTDSGTAVRCANIYAEGVFADGSGDRYDVGSYACGHDDGACPNGRKVITEGTETYWVSEGNAECDESGTAFEIWSVVYGGNTQIELPVSDKTFELDASDGGNDGINYSSGHYQACPFIPTPE